MKHLSILLLVLTIATALIVMNESLASAQQTKSAFKYEDPIGVVKIKPSEPIHIACWMVVAGPDSSLGTDTKRGVEIAVDDKGSKLLGFPIKLTVQDTGCNAEGGQAAATKLAADPTIVSAIGSSWRPVPAENLPPDITEPL